MIKANWKTNLLGSITIVLALAKIWGPPSIQQRLSDTQTQLTGLAGLVGFGLLAAKDSSNKN